MSRIGKKIIEIGEKTEVTVSNDSFTVKGPLGELTKPYNPIIEIIVADGTVTLNPKKDNKLAKSLWGTYASHIINMIKGVNEKYEKKLEIEGVGYRAEMKGNTLVLSIGFSHQVEMPVPEDLTVTVEKNLITVSGIDKESVGEFSAKTRAQKKPEPYKGKGIHYVGEYIRRKEGKKAV